MPPLRYSLYSRVSRKEKKAIGSKIKQRYSHLLNKPNLQGSDNSRDAAGSALTVQHDVQRAYFKQRKKRKITSRGRKLKYRKRKFKRNVAKVLSGKQPTYHYNERSSGPMLMNIMPTVWGTEPCQQALGNEKDATPDFIRSAGFSLFEGLPLNGDYNDAATCSGVGRYFAQAIGNVAERYSGADQNADTNWLTTFDAYIKHCQIGFHIYNNQAVPINVDIYEFTAQRDIPRNDWYYSPIAAMNYIRTVDAIYFSTNMTNVTNITDYGATPWDFPGLSNHWKVTNKTTVYLSASGQTHVSFKGNKGMWRGKIGNECTAIKNKTTSYVFIVGSKIGQGMDNTTAPIKVYFDKTYKIKAPYGVQYAKPNFKSSMTFKYNNI